MQRLLTLGVLLLGALLLPRIAAAADVMDPQLREKARRASDAGIRYLHEHQAEDGSWSKSVGVTALALRAILESYRGYSEADGAFVTRPVQFLLKNANPDGSIVESLQNRNYNTAVAVYALQATKNPAYAETIKNAQSYLRKLQIDEGEGYAPEHKYYGGIGYGGDERPDLSNQSHALEALKATAVDPKDPVWEKALVFVNRCQNRSESNDQSWAANDGGFIYMPGYGPYGGTGSYGTMTHAGLFSLLAAGVDKQDPRVQSAYDWIRANYTVDENPGVEGGHNLFFYYNILAKTLYLYGEPEIADAKGVAHNWRNDLAAKLISLQASDGSWVNTVSTRYWEGNKDLVTAWSVIALNTLARQPSDAPKPSETKPGEIKTGDAKKPGDAKK